MMFNKDSHCLGSVTTPSGSTLNTFKEFSQMVDWVGPWAAPNRGLIYIQKINGLCHYNFQSVDEVAAVNNSIISLPANTIPSDFTPFGDHFLGPVMVNDAGNGVDGGVRINGDGSVQIGVTLDQNPFQISGGARFYNISFNLVANPFI